MSTFPVLVLKNEVKIFIYSSLALHETKAVFTPQLWDRNRSGTQPGARVHTCSTASSRSGTSRPSRDVIAVERFRNGSGWLCGVNAQPDAFRSRLASPCVIMTNIQYILPKFIQRKIDILWWIPRFRHSRRNIWHVCPIRTQFGSFQFS